jgi:hypothetical protein
MVKVVIIVEKGLTAGQKANAASIIMGQLTADNPGIYADHPVKDIDGNNHAAIRENVIIVEAGSGQLYNLLEAARSEKENIEKAAVSTSGALKQPLDYAVFSKTGQNLSGNFDAYHQEISRSKTLETNLVGIGLRGDFETITKLTKKFSLMK